MQEPLVTVLIPVYNRPTIINTIESITQQTYKNLEILIIDNASTDNTVSCIKNIDDDRIKLIVNDNNIGQTRSMNKGLKIANGKYIARIDSDDIALSTRIEKQVKFMETHPDYVLVGSWIQYISDDDKIGGIMKMCTTDDGLRFMQTFSCGIHHPTAMYRTDIIRANKIEYEAEIHMAEDYELWRKLLHYGKGCNLGEVLVYYRRGSYNDSLQHYNQMVRESRMVRRRVCNELDLSDSERMNLNAALDIAETDDKTILETFKYIHFMYYFLKKHISKDNPDYKLLRRYIFQMGYGVTIENNHRLYAKPIIKLYNILRARMH